MTSNTIAVPRPGGTCGTLTSTWSCGVIIDVDEESEAAGLAGRESREEAVPFEAGRDCSDSNWEGKGEGPDDRAEMHD